MNSLSNECQELKALYDSCFNHWYSEKFLHGSKDDQTCEPVYQEYRQCVNKALKRLKIDIPKIEGIPSEEKQGE